MANRNRTFKELQDAVQTEMQLDPGLISVEERKSFINDALYDMASTLAFEKQAEIDVEEGYARLPDDFKGVIDVKYEGRYLVPMEIPKHTFDGSPVGYYLRYDSIELIPQANSGVVTLYYSYSPKPMVIEEEKPDIPNGYDLMLIDYAVSRAHRKNGNIGLAREYMYAYDTRKQAMAQEYMQRVNSRVTDIINRENMQAPSTPFDFL